MKPTIAIALLIASYIYLATVTFGTSHKPLSGGDATHVRAPSTVQPMAKGVQPAAQPPRLFLNGEVAKVWATGRKVVVQSAQWDKGCRCYVYTVTPYK